MERKKCQKCGINRQLKFYKTPQGRICTICQKKGRYATTKNRRLQETYGITLEDYQTLWEAQDGKCAICRGVRAVFDVDHRHSDGIVRGLLCRACNRKVLPFSKDNPETLRAAANYLENPPAIDIIGEVIAPTSVKPAADEEPTDE